MVRPSGPNASPGAWRFGCVEKLRRRVDVITAPHVRFVDLYQLT